MEIFKPQFGLLVAYLLPGFVGLGGIALLVPTVATWLQPTGGQSGWEIGPPVYALLAATAMGMVFSCCRWVLIDHLHQWTGVKAPVWNFAGLESRLQAFHYIVEGTYRYYQFYANTLIAILWTYSINRLIRTSSFLGLGTDLGVVVLCAILFAGSRDALAKYYERSGQLVGWVAEKGIQGDGMTNGFHQEDGKRRSTSKGSEAKQPAKQEKPNQVKEKTQRRSDARSQPTSAK